MYGVFINGGVLSTIGEFVRQKRNSLGTIFCFIEIRMHHSCEYTTSFRRRLILEIYKKVLCYC